MEIAVGVPKPFSLFETAISGGFGLDNSTPLEFDQTKRGFEAIHSNPDVYFSDYPSAERVNPDFSWSWDSEIFEKIRTLCLSLGWFTLDEKGIVVLENLEIKRSKEMVESLESLSRTLIDRELDYYTQSIKYRYSSSKEEAVPEFTCLHQLMYYSLLALDRNAKYVDCSREKCLNKTVQLYGDKIIPCCCSNCRKAAASKRNRDKHKV